MTVHNLAGDVTDDVVDVYRPRVTPLQRGVGLPILIIVLILAASGATSRIGQHLNGVEDARLSTDPFSGGRVNKVAEFGDLVILGSL